MLDAIAAEVKTALKPFFVKKRIDKDQYKEVLKKSVLKVCLYHHLHK